MPPTSAAIVQNWKPTRARIMSWLCRLSSRSSEAMPPVSAATVSERKPKTAGSARTRRSSFWKSVSLPRWPGVGGATAFASVILPTRRVVPDDSDEATDASY
jgi:hypothetical protein